MRLVADIGGTNARLALASSGRVQAGTVRSFRNADFRSFDEVAERYLREASAPRPPEVVAAVAGPVRGGQVRLTNRDWLIDAEALGNRLGASRVQLVNDLTALGYAAPGLGADQLVPVVEGAPAAGALRQSLVLGIGTGFNVSPVLQSGPSLICPIAEAGHVSLPAGVSQALERRRAGLSAAVPTIEECFSGRGFAMLCREVTGRADLQPSDIARACEGGGVHDVAEAVAFYAELIGWLLRDLMLAYMPTSGIYFAGGVARAVLSSPHRGRCSEVMGRPFRIGTRTDIPVWIINDDAAALQGCARLSFVDAAAASMPRAGVGVR